MNKYYILLALAFVTGLTAFIFGDTETSTDSLQIVEASIVSPALIKKTKNKELSDAEKEVLFKEYAQLTFDKIKGDKPALPVFTQALNVYYTLDQEDKITNKGLLTIVDFSLPSTEKRLWLIDLKNNQVVENIVVSHGKYTGMNKAKSFSNEINSYQSSLGAYVTAETYVGKHGLSLRLDGLEDGFNDNARTRDIVVHTAAYANPGLIERQGRLGRSLGCPAIPEDKLDIIELISGGSLLYVYANDENYISNTRFNDYTTSFGAIENFSENII